MSAFDFDETPDGDDPEFPREKAEKLVEEFTEAARKIGLYVMDADISVMVPAHPDAETGVPIPDEDGPRTRVLRVQCSIGEVAFSPRVLDPPTDEMNDEFRKITVADLDDDIERIKERYQNKEQKKDDDSASD